MPDADKIEEFLDKLKPCIYKGELDACVDEAARVAEEMGIGAHELLVLSGDVGDTGLHAFTYVITLSAAQYLDSKDKSIAHSVAGLAAKNIGKIELSEKNYKKAIELNPKNADVYYNYANLLYELDYYEESEKNYKKSIELNPEDADVHCGYANLLKERKKHDQAKEHYIKAIELNPENTIFYNNYASLLIELGNYKEAEKNYKKENELNPEDVMVYNNYANLLRIWGKYDQAEDYYKKAIELNPEIPEIHGGYSLLLVEQGKLNRALEEIEISSNIFKKLGAITQSHLVWAWFYKCNSEKFLKKKEFHESGKYAEKAANEFLEAAKTVDGEVKDHILVLGYISKAKSFIRKVPTKSWCKKIPYWFVKNPDITNIINNLKEAALYYKKAAQYPIKEKQDICDACHISIYVFSETLSAMDTLINNVSTEIDKKEWIKKLDSARLIYEDKKMNDGIVLVDTLKQLIKCVDKLPIHKKNWLDNQKVKSGKCYNKLVDVSENLDGALNVIVEHSIEWMGEHLDKQGVNSFITNTPKKSIWNNWFVRGGIFIVATIFLDLVSSKLYDLNILATIWNYLKSLIP